MLKMPLRIQVELMYLKPVQTGYPEDSDVRMVVRCRIALFLSSTPASHLPI